MSERGFLRGLQKAFAKPDDTSGRDDDDPKLKARRRFLGMLSGVIASPVLPGDGAVGKAIGERVAGAGGKAVFERLGEEAQKKALEGLGGSLTTSAKQILKRFSGSEGRDQREKRMYETFQEVRELMLQPDKIGTAGPISPDTLKTFAPIRAAEIGQLRGLPSEMKLSDIIGGDIEHAMDGVLGPDGNSLLPDASVRKELAEQLQKMTGLDANATIAEIEDAYRSRMTDISKHVYENLDNPLVCDPAQREEILEALGESLPPTPENAELRNVIAKKRTELFTKRRAAERKQDAEDARQESEEKKESIEKRDKVRASLSEDFSNPSTFHLILDVEPRDAKHIRRIEPIDIFQFVQMRMPDAQPWMLKVEPTPNGAVIKSSDIELTELLKMMSGSEEGFDMPDRLHERPMWKR